MLLIPCDKFLVIYVSPVQPTIYLRRDAKEKFCDKSICKVFFCSFTEFSGCEKLLLNPHAEKRTLLHGILQK